MIHISFINILQRVAWCNISDLYHEYWHISVLASHTSYSFICVIPEHWGLKHVTTMCRHHKVDKSTPTPITSLVIRPIRMTYALVNSKQLMSTSLLLILSQELRHTAPRKESISLVPVPHLRVKKQTNKQ